MKPQKLTERITVFLLIVSTLFVSCEDNILPTNSNSGDKISFEIRTKSQNGAVRLEFTCDTVPDDIPTIVVNDLDFPFEYIDDNEAILWWSESLFFPGDTVSYSIRYNGDVLEREFLLPLAIDSIEFSGKSFVPFTRTQFVTFDWPVTIQFNSQSEGNTSFTYHYTSTEYEEGYESIHLENCSEIYTIPSLDSAEYLMSMSIDGHIRVEGSDPEVTIESNQIAITENVWGPSYSLYIKWFR